MVKQRQRPKKKKKTQKSKQYIDKRYLYANPCIYTHRTVLTIYMVYMYVKSQSVSDWAS